MSIPFGFQKFLAISWLIIVAIVLYSLIIWIAIVAPMLVLAIIGFAAVCGLTWWSILTVLIFQTESKRKCS